MSVSAAKVKGPKSPQKKVKAQLPHQVVSDSSDAAITEEKENDESYNFPLAKKLAHNSLKTRNKAMKSVRIWLSRPTEMTETDLLKLWRGLFYCFWMSDKPLVQYELAENLAQLLHADRLTDDRARLFFQAFLQTMSREWTGIDRLRMDKFMALVRKFVHHALKYLDNHKWDTTLISEWMNLFTAPKFGPLTPNLPANIGLCLHVLDVFLTELCQVVSSPEATQTFTFEAASAVLRPFLSLLSVSKDAAVARRVRERVFFPLIAALSETTEAHRSQSIIASDFPAEIQSILSVFDGHLTEMADTFFNLAADKNTFSKERDHLYHLKSQFSILANYAAQATEVVVQEEGSKKRKKTTAPSNGSSSEEVKVAPAEPKPSGTKKQKSAAVNEVATETASETKAQANGAAAGKKNKKRAQSSDESEAVEEKLETKAEPAKKKVKSPAVNGTVPAPKSIEKPAAPQAKNKQVEEKQKTSKKAVQSTDSPATEAAPAAEKAAKSKKQKNQQPEKPDPVAPTTPKTHKKTNPPSPKTPAAAAPSAPPASAKKSVKFEANKIKTFSKTHIVSRVPSTESLLAMKSPRSSLRRSPSPDRHEVAAPPPGWPLSGANADSIRVNLTSFADGEKKKEDKTPKKKQQK